MFLYAENEDSDRSLRWDNLSEGRFPDVAGHLKDATTTLNTRERLLYLTYVCEKGPYTMIIYKLRKGS